MRGNRNEWCVGCKSANKKSLAKQLAKSYSSSPSQALETAPQPTHHFC